MYIETLQILQVRNLQTIQLSPGNRLNFFTGKNASGKTAILEAIFLLSRGRSFRSPRIQEVIQHNQKTLRVSARIHQEQQGPIHTGLEKGYGETIIKYNGNKITTISEQSRAMPLVLVTQESHTLITGAPKDRRHWLDWAMFHVEQEYLEQWKVYMKALRHRNILLKKGENKRELYRAWEQGMIESGHYLAKTRQEYLSQLNDVFQDLARPKFAGVISICLSTDWPGYLLQHDIFETTWKNDQKLGYTRNGSHNIDIKFTNESKQIANVYSRGQIKLFICLLALAQAKIQAERTGVAPIVLIDDYVAELDSEACEYLLDQLAGSNYQVFLTDTNEQKHIQNRSLYSSFHVEHGTARPI
jgi:DNA replication and repair protein RecF